MKEIWSGACPGRRKDVRKLLRDRHGERALGLEVQLRKEIPGLRRSIPCSLFDGITEV